MSLARKVALGFLSFLLFVSLSGFVFAFTINRTALNPDFIVSRLDTLDVSSLAAEVLKEQVPEEVMGMVPAELIDEVLDDVLTELAMRVMAGATLKRSSYGFGSSPAAPPGRQFRLQRSKPSGLRCPGRCPGLNPGAGSR